MKKSILFFLVILYLPVYLSGDAASIDYARGGTIQLMNNEYVSMEEELISITLHRHRFEVNVKYTFHNSGKKRTVLMGFPNSIKPGVGPELSDIGITDFAAYEQGRQLEVFRKTGPSYDGKETIIYECFEVDFEEGERKEIINTYSQDYSREYGSDEGILAEYILKTGASWAGVINSIKVFISTGTSARVLRNKKAYFVDEYSTPPEFYEWNFELEVSPDDYQLLDNDMLMEFTDVEPDFNIVIKVPPPFIKRVTASSELPAGANCQYTAENLIDGNPDTAWVEGLPGSGIGEYVDFATNPFMGNAAGAYKVKGIGIINGYAASKNLFIKNNRVKEIRIDCENYLYSDDNTFGFVEMESFTFTLSDKMEMQYLTFPHPVFMSSMKITILDIYPGTHWDDTCIAEVKLLTD